MFSACAKLGALVIVCTLRSSCYSFSRRDKMPLDPKDKEALLQAWQQGLKPDTPPGQTIQMQALEGDAGDPDEIESISLKDLPSGYAAGHVLGEGGMGLVVEAEQASLQRTVALKTVSSPENQEHLQRFLREALTVGSLDHPVIPPVYELAQDPAGRPYLIMKKVEGKPWDSVLHEKTLHENLEILLHVCDGIAFAHSKGIIHRDIKPENVLLGGFGEVYLMDWGLAVKAGADGFFLHAIGGEAGAGSPAYMAPEMALAIGPEIGFHSDIYLLGAVLFEIVTGVPPHPGEDAEEALLSASDNTIELTGQSTELTRIALEAMATEPVDRPTSVQAFQQQIRLYLQHAESVELSTLGESYLKQAIKSAEYADYNEAQSSLKQALNLWPENERAKSKLRKARLGYAKVAISRNDLDLAASQLEPADSEQRSLLNAIQVERAQIEKRKLQYARLQKGVLTLLSFIVLVLLVATLWIQEERKRAETALVQFQQEQSDRQIDRRTSAPALVLTAKRLAALGQDEEAMATAQAALDFDPTLVSAHYLRLGLLLREGRYKDAWKAAKLLAKQEPTSSDAQEMLNITQKVATTNPGSEQTAILGQLTPILGRHGMSMIGAEFALTDRERLDLWREQLRQAWPKAEISGYDMRWVSSEGIYLRLPADAGIEDLTPLSGIPIIRLNLSGLSKISDLSPLEGMPLRELSLSDCEQITDLSPLAGLPLERLDLSGAFRVEDLSPLQSMSLNSLDLSNLDRIESIEALRGMPLRELDLHRARKIDDISALQHSNLEELSISNSAVSNLAPLAGLPLKKLSARGLTIDSLQPLASLPLEELNLAGTLFPSAEPLRNLQLIEADFRTESIVDIGFLENMPLRELELDYVQDLQPLRNLPLKELSLGTVEAEAAPQNLSVLHELPLENLSLIGDALVWNISWLDGIALERLSIALVSWVENPELDFSLIKNAKIKELILPADVPFDSLYALKQIEKLKKVGFQREELMSVENFIQELNRRSE